MNGLPPLGQPPARHVPSYHLRNRRITSGSKFWPPINYLLRLTHGWRRATTSMMCCCIKCAIIEAIVAAICQAEGQGISAKGAAVKSGTDLRLLISCFSCHVEQGEPQLRGRIIFRGLATRASEKSPQSAPLRPLRTKPCLYHPV